MHPEVIYRTNAKISVDDFVDLLRRSTLAERRPVNDRVRMQKMLDHAAIVVTAWAGDGLIGVSRAITDFAFSCYLSDLAVDRDFQHRGIGRELVRLTHECAGPERTLMLLAAPKAVDYYPKIGMTNFPHCFVFDRKK